MEETPRERNIEEVEEDDDNLNQLHGDITFPNGFLQLQSKKNEELLTVSATADAGAEGERKCESEMGGSDMAPGPVPLGTGPGDGTSGGNVGGGSAPSHLSVVAPHGTVQAADGTTSHPGQSGETRSGLGGGARSVEEDGSGTVGDGRTILLVKNLNWWTRDVDLEAELEKYGRVKEMEFLVEEETGKSMGSCWVEFYDPAAATACQKRMNGHLFYGRSCIVSFSQHRNLNRRGEEQVKHNEPKAELCTTDARFGRGNWERGNTQGMGSRGAIDAMSNRLAGMYHRDFTGNVDLHFMHGVGPTPPLMPPWATPGPSLGLAFGGPMGVIAPIMGNYGGFPGAPTPSFSGMIPPFSGPVGNAGYPGVAAPAYPNFDFRGRSMPMNRMGMIPNYGVARPNTSMSSYTNVVGGRGVESKGYWEVDVSDRRNQDDRVKDMSFDRYFSERKHHDERAIGRDHSHGRDRERSHDRDYVRSRDQERKNYPSRDHGRSRALEYPRYQDCGQSSHGDRGQSYYCDRERERDKDHHIEERDKHSDHHGHRDREPQHSDDRERGQSSSTQSESRVSQDEDEHPRSEDAEGKKR